MYHRQLRALSTERQAMVIIPKKLAVSAKQIMIGATRKDKADWKP